jgi:hypothetical protein
MADIAMMYVGAHGAIVVLGGCAENVSCSWLASDLHPQHPGMQFYVIDGRTPCKCGSQVP